MQLAVALLLTQIVNQLSYLKYEFEVFESLVGKFSESSQHHSKDESKSLTNVISLEKERIKSSFVQLAFSGTDDKQIERYFQNHQQALIRLTDQIQVLQGNKESEGESSLQIMSSALEELLMFIEKHFTKYFDLSSKIPESYKRVVANEFESKVRAIKKTFRSRKLNPELIDIILRPFESLYNDQFLSFKKLIFIRELHSELIIFKDTDYRDEQLESHMCTSIVYLNFNSIKLFNYCVKKIKNDYLERETLNEQLERLALHLKLVNQRQEKPGFYYKPGHKSIKVQLLEWITEEIIYLERKHQLSFIFKAEKSYTPSQKIDFKLLTDSSVPKVAYFVRILIETGLIKNQNVLEVIRFFANSVSTNRAGTISAESFRTKFYNTEDSAKAAVESDVLMLLDHIRKSK